MMEITVVSVIKVAITAASFYVVLLFPIYRLNHLTILSVNFGYKELFNLVPFTVIN